MICVITARTALCAAAAAAATPCATATQCTYLHERVGVRPKLRCTVLCGVATCCPALYLVVQCCETAARGPVRWAAMGPALLVNQGILFMRERLHAGTQGAVPLNALARRLALRATTPRGHPNLSQLNGVKAMRRTRGGPGHRHECGDRVPRRRVGRSARRDCADRRENLQPTTDVCSPGGIGKRRQPTRRQEPTKSRHSCCG